ARPVGELPIAPLGRYPGVRLVFSPDGKALAAGHRHGGGPAGGGPAGTWYPLAFTADGKNLAVAQLRGTTLLSPALRRGPRDRVLVLPRPGPAVAPSCDGPSASTCEKPATSSGREPGTNTTTPRPADQRGGLSTGSSAKAVRERSE